MNQLALLFKLVIDVHDLFLDAVHLAELLPLIISAGLELVEKLAQLGLDRLLAKLFFAAISAHLSLIRDQALKVSLKRFNLLIKL